MTFISSNETSDIVRVAKQTLKSQYWNIATLTTTKSSAESAIELTANRVSRLGEAACNRLQHEMEMLRNKTAQEIANITSQKDEVILQTKAQAQKEIAKVKEEANAAIKQSKASKLFEKILPNGNKLIRKHNKNGAVLEEELVLVKDANGEISEHVLSAKVTNLAGDVRKTKFNPMTEKPISTYTNTVKPRLYEYNYEGKNTSIKDVNVKKVTPEKPILVSQSGPQRVTTYYNEPAVQVQRVYSNGTTETIMKVISRDNPRTMIEKKSASEQVLERRTIWAENNSERIEKYGEDGTYSYTEKQTNLYGYPYSKTIVSVNDSFIGRNAMIRQKLLMRGYQIDVKRQKDEFGIYTDIFKGTCKYPKESGKKPVKLEGTDKEIANFIRTLNNV